MNWSTSRLGAEKPVFELCIYAKMTTQAISWKQASLFNAVLRQRSTQDLATSAWRCDDLKTICPTLNRGRGAVWLSSDSIHSAPIGYAIPAGASPFCKVQGLQNRLNHSLTAKHEA
jgi:hypothetical protein